MTQIVGILNLTDDSFSDGGRYRDPEVAVSHALEMVRCGATIIDVGPESTHPDAADVPPIEQIERLRPVLAALSASRVSVSVDASEAVVVRAALEQGASWINDVTALRDPETVRVVRDHDCRVVLMHSISAKARADRDAPTATVDSVIAFFRERIAALEAIGLTRERLILDPGMGFFVGSGPLASIELLQGIGRLRELGLPVLVSTSRKSFIGELLADAGPDDETTRQPRPVAERGPGTLATELWAATQRVDYVRTHDVRALHDALTIWRRLDCAVTG